MNPRTAIPAAPRPVARRLVPVTLLALGAALALLVPVDAHRAPRSEPAAPLVSILTPQDSLALNAATLRVRALVAAVKSARGEDFPFDGATVAGRNAGRIRSVALALDGVEVATIDPSRDGPQIVATFEVDLAGLAAGAHLLDVTAVAEHSWRQTTERVMFTLDPTLPIAEQNRIEEAATPEPFQGFVVRARGWTDGSDAVDEGDDDEDTDDHSARLSSGRFALSGRIAPSHLSDGFDLSKDRIVVALGSQVVVFEPGELTCRRRVCRAPAGRGFLDTLQLRNGQDGRWQFRFGGKLAAGSDPSTLFVRIGNDWGGVDLRTGARIARLPEALDVTHQASGLIGTPGGTVQTLDASGVLIRVDVPAGALVRDTLIMMTPLSTSPLAGPPSAIHPGVKLEPEGLVFATPASLTFDFSATGQVITPDHFIFLLTSPLTALPLVGAADPVQSTLTASLPHFSIPQPGAGNTRYQDLRAWADAVLASTNNLTLSEIETLLEFAALQQSVGCTTNCVDLVAVADRAGASIAALVGGICPAGGAPTASDAALTRLLQLEMLAQQLGTNVPTIRPCMEAVLGALIDQAATTAASPTDPVLSRLADLAARAQALGFSQLETRALQKLAQALRDLAARLLAQVNAARGTTNETAVTGAAKTDLQNELQFASGNGRLLQTDLNLLADIQAAIDSLSGGLSLTVEPFGAANIQGCGGNRRRDLPPTLNITCSDDLTSLTFTVTKGPNNTLIVNATGSAAERGFVRAKISGRLTVNRPGRVTYDLNPNWGSRGIGSISDPRVDTTISGPIVLPLDISGTVFFPPTIPRVGSAEFLTGVYDFSFFVDLPGPSEGACDPEICPSARANGRIVTLTFMP